MKELKRARNKAWRELSAHIRAERGACEICGATEKLQVHHVLPKKQHPDLLLEENDLICLCARHHFLWHHGHDVEGIVWLADNKPAQWVWIAERARQYGKT